LGNVRIRNHFVELVTKKVRDLAKKSAKLQSSSTMAFNKVVEKRFPLHKFDVCGSGETQLLPYFSMFQKTSHGPPIGSQT
jgi:hypothetical protein